MPDGPSTASPTPPNTLLKPVNFDYLRAGSIAEVCERLHALGEDARVLAGGQTLVPLLAMRLARPSVVIDINAVPDLAGITDAADHVAIRACTRQADTEASPIVRARLPLLAKGIRFVGHDQTRNRGTVGGSLVNADPSAEIALVAAALEATLVTQGTDDLATLPAADFFVGPMATALDPQRLLVEARFPVWGGGHRIGSGFHEVNVRSSDYALVSAAAQVALDADGTCRRATLAIGAANPFPIRIAAAADALVGNRLDDARIHAAAALVADAIEPSDDQQASAAYRRRTAVALAIRALTDARDEASRP